MLPSTRAHVHGGRLGTRGSADESSSGLLRILLALSLGALVGMSYAVSRTQRDMSLLNAELVSALNVASQVNAAAGTAGITASKASLAGAVSSSSTATGIAANMYVPTSEDVPNEELKAVLERVAVNREVLAAVSNKALISEDGNYGMLKTWVDSVRASGVKNFMVVALDDHTAHAMDKIGVARWRRDPTKLRDMNLSNHGISAQKFHMLREFLVLGYSVLLSDVDIVTLKNPFEHLVRDSDVEGMSDGADERTAYGWDDVADHPEMGWSRFAHTVRWYVMNSGLFYLRPTVGAVALMDRCTDRLSKQDLWDQQVFNEELYFPARPGAPRTPVSARVADIDTFMNSKRLFVHLRKSWSGQSRAKEKAAMIHVNYHPDKWERMKSIIDIWQNGESWSTLDKYPDGSCFGAPNC